MKNYEKFAKKIALRAGKIIRSNFTLGMKKEWKADLSPVTETDKVINKLVIKEIKKNYPDHKIKGEEESDMSGSGEYVWVCDPVDGTIPFSAGVPICTFSLALVEDGIPILGVVYDPFMDRLFFSEKGGGAFLNDKKIQVSTSDKIEQSLINMEGFSVAKYQINNVGVELSRRHAKVGKYCSIIYPSVLVASGEFAATIFPGYTAHDGAAVKIIVEEAGGKVTDLFGEEQRYDQEINGFIASNGKIHDYLVELIKKNISNK